jgi:hypothetical protein
VLPFGGIYVSSTKLRSAKFSINELVKSTQGHAFASQADMRHMLYRCVKDLHELGFKVGHIKGLQPKHIYALVDHWKNQGKNPATIKNYMSKLRKTAVLIGNPKLVKPDNATYQIDKRSYKPLQNKAIHQIDLSKCTDPYIRLSLEGQALFGLRREESMKFIFSEAYQGNTLKIMPSWTKGGIGRTLNITNEAQKQWLDKIAAFVPSSKSLIPQDRTYKQHLSHYQAQAKLMGVSKLHGLRHAYAQQRYQELTNGLICPIQGGTKYQLMTNSEKIRDRKARNIISRELGHSRINITKIYLG